MKTKLKIQVSPDSSLLTRIVRPLCAIGLLCSLSLHAATPPDPAVELRFPEGTNGWGGAGVITTNTGTMAGNATFAQPVDPLYETNLAPIFTTNVPSGTFVPAANDYAVDFGPIIGSSLGGSHGRAIDLATDTGPFGGTLGAFPKLTVCGWVNARDLGAGAGGNRIAYALETPGGLGWELVSRNAGQIQLGVNEYNDSAPSSSSGIVTPSATLASNNWVFIAVTYDPTLGSEHLKYYYGKPNRLAQLDSAHNYTPATTAIDFTGFLTVGNFGVLEGGRDGSLGGNTRIFRGLVDELKVYTNALTLDEIQQAQINSAVTPVAASIITPPVNTLATEGQNAVFTVLATGPGLVTYQWKTNNVNVSGATNTSFAVNSVQVAQTGMSVQVGVSNSVGGVLSTSVSLTVLPNVPLMVQFSFPEGTGTSTTNLGSFGGRGAFRRSGGIPIFTATNLPSGPFSPTPGYNPYSLYTGAFGVGFQRGVDMTNNLIYPNGKLGSMNGLTICGWLNSANETFRTTSTGRGNRIVSASLGNNLGGFTLTYRENALNGSPASYNTPGRLKLDVNEWETDGAGNIAVSSPNTVTYDPTLSPTNWVFFAVTYDGTNAVNNLKYYFGNAATAATNDVTISYNQGVIADTSPITIGQNNASAGNPTIGNSGTNGSNFRGLIDELKIYNKVLTQTEIQNEQFAGALPTLLIYSNTGPNLDLSWETLPATPYQLQSRTNLAAGSWINVTNSESVIGNIHKVSVPRDKEAEFYRINR